MSSHVLKSSHDVVTLMILVMIGKRFDFVSTMIIASAFIAVAELCVCAEMVFYTTVY